MEGATLRRLRRSWISTISSVCALAIALSLMSMSDVGRNLVRPEHVLDLGGGAPSDHSGFGNSMFPPPEKTRPGAPVDRESTTTTTVGDTGTAASLISASGDDVGSGNGGPNDTTTTSTVPVVVVGHPRTSTTTTTTPTTPTTDKPVHVVDDQYTDGTQCAGALCPGGPPPQRPVFMRGSKCKTDLIDPPSLTFVTEHFVYGTTPPPAREVPVVDDASVVSPYLSSAPGMLHVDVEAFVAGKQGFRAATWTIGQGVTAWVPFDCRSRKTATTTTTTTTSTTTTTVAKTKAHVEGVDPKDFCPRDAVKRERAATAEPRRQGRTARRSSR